MGSMDEVLKLLKRKAGLFGQYEMATRALVTDDRLDVERIEAALAARQKLIEEIDGIDAGLSAVRDGSLEGRRIYDIGKNRCDYSTLNEQECRLFEEGQNLFAVMTRIRDLEVLASESMNAMHEELQDKIRQNNVNVKFSGYLKQMGQGSKGLIYDKTR